MENQRSTSTIAPLCRSAGNILADLAPSQELEKLLECPVCHDIPLPPIFNCQTGHTICNKCKIKVKECPICKAAFTTSRSFVSESIILSSSFYCFYHDRGCDVIGNAQVQNDHRETCIFRPAKCYLSGLGGCGKGELVFLPEYLNHLIGVHKLTRMCTVETKQNVFKRLYYWRNWDNVIWRKETCKRWSNAYCIFDGKVFVTRTSCRGTNFFFQMAVISDLTETDQGKYTVKVTIENDKFLKYELTSLVPSIRKYHDDVQSVSEGVSRSVNKELLDELGRRVQMEEESKFKLSWDVRYELTKV